MSNQLRGFEQIIWNDTQSNPYAEESIVRRLLASGASDEYVQALYQYSEEELDALKEKNEDVIYKVRKQIRAHEKHCKKRSTNQVDHMMDGFFLHQQIMANALMISVSQYRELLNNR